MPQIEIRPSRVSDLETLLALERDYISHYVHQFDIEQSEEDETLKVTLRRVRLPRQTRVNYPRNREQLLDEWSHCDGILVTELQGQIVGFVALSMSKIPQTVWITDLIVSKAMRRQGIARALLLAAEEWAMAKSIKRIVLEMQSRNDPAIQMAKKLGFNFCGFQEYYYPNGDVGLFFARSIR